MTTRHWALLIIALVFTVGVELLALDPASRGPLWWAHVPGFVALFGYLVSLALAFLSKALGKYWLQRDERYYRRGRSGDE
jgi:hypothetical protein